MPASSAPEPPTELAPSAVRPRVLIVDDNQANLTALGAVLEPLEVEVVRATSGEQALRQLLQHDFAVVLMDVQMPGLNGFETTELIRQRDRTRHTPIIFVTAIFKDREWADKAYSLGAYDYLSKPFDEDVLRAKVAAIVGTHQQVNLIRRQAAALHAKEREADQAQAALVAAETANRAKDNFLAMISHELRAPLSAVLGWTAILEARADLPADVAKPIATIARNARAQSRLIDDLLDVSRIVAGKLSVSSKPLDLRRLLAASIETARPAATARGVRLELSVAPGEYAMNGDWMRLEQVVANLLSNAIKFSNAGGRIDVELSRRDDTLRLRVRDDGIGISPSFLPYVFERFQQADDSKTRQYGGLGIGLTVSKYLVAMHGGTIAAASAGQGQGSLFTIELPAIAGEAVSALRAAAGVEARAEAPVAAAHAEDSEPLKALRVLVVDDDADQRELLVAILAAAGAQATTAASAREALAAFEAGDYDLLLSDVGMPGEDGLLLMRKIRDMERERGGALIAVALSGYGGADDRAQSLEAGFEAHLVKPAEPSVIVQQLRQLVSQSLLRR